MTQRASVLDMSVPSKLTSYFVSGRPVVASVADEGGTAQEVRRSGAGVLVAPEDPGALLAAVRKLVDGPAEADALGARGPEYVARHLSREAGLARFDALLTEVLADAPRETTPMTHPIRALEDQDEPALLRDQFRQLLRYRALLAAGVVVGLLGGGCLALSGDDDLHGHRRGVRTLRHRGPLRHRRLRRQGHQHRLRAADRGQRRGRHHRRRLPAQEGDDRVTVGKLLTGLQVTNPPNTLVLRFSYTGRTPAGQRAGRGARRRLPGSIARSAPRTASTTWSNGYRAQLEPLDRAARQAGRIGPAPAATT